LFIRLIFAGFIHLSFARLLRNTSHQDKRKQRFQNMS